ncbi:TIGR01906 family membrane protein [Pseudarthrobacter sp. YS3]|uniref:TIGR01906 family membrane protein n=1 Tax=Pseudarthrobacter sp. YS3 TaxID=3453718 RepID=UPI003EE852C2
MNDNSPTPAKRSEPQPDPDLDASSDSDEPAFAWMTGSGSDSPDASGTEGSSPNAASPNAANANASNPNASNPGGVHAGQAAAQPESRADRKAAEAAVEHSAVDPSASEGSSADESGPEPSGKASAGRKATGPDSAGRETAGHNASHMGASPASGRKDAGVFSEPLPTSALQVRPPQDEVERRNAERESAANAKPVPPRVWQVLLAIFYPVILLVLAVRAVTSPLFLWVEYNRPGFPGDGYGFSADDRMTYGSYTVDYLSNWAGPRYLGDLVNRSGADLFKDGEVSHMADVKLVILSAFGAGLLLILLSLVGIAYLRRRSNGGVRRGLFAGSIIALVIILGLGALAVLGWQQFFTEFHRLFFAGGTWTFALEDTLIRLFPGQFWIDAGIVIAGLVFLVSLVTLILTWPTRRRRGLVKDKGVNDQQAVDDEHAAHDRNAAKVQQAGAAQA